MKLALCCGIAALAAAPAFANDKDLAAADALDGTDQYAEALLSGAVDTLEHHDTDDTSHQRGWRHVREVCSRINLTDEQKPQLMDAHLDYKEAKIQLKADLKKAKLQFVRLALDADADVTSASAIVTDGVAAKTGLAQAKGDMATTIMFTILTAEQRGPALKCLMAYKKMKKHD